LTERLRQQPEDDPGEVALEGADGFPPALALGLLPGPRTNFAGARLVGLETRDNEPTLGPSTVDQLLGREAYPRTQVGQVSFHRTRPNAHEVGCVSDGSACLNEGGEDLDLSSSRALAPSRRSDQKLKVAPPFTVAAYTMH
jgi:hypothetical protein